jgi:DNA-3-methyladenine glycosylase
MPTTLKATLLKPEFFNRDPRRVARVLLGKLLIRKTSHKILAGRIVETEAYMGEGDEAAHAAAGQTARNAVLFGPPGYAYVYFIYGVHYCVNVSCMQIGAAGSVLFRALEPVLGIEEMARARGLELAISEFATSEFATMIDREMADRQKSDRQKILFLKKISSGPGRLTEALEITRERDNGKCFVSRQSDLQIVDDGYRVGRVAVTLRIGIAKSIEQPLRFCIAGNPFVSGRGCTE